MPESVRPFNASPWIRPDNLHSQTNLGVNETKSGTDPLPQPPYGVRNYSTK